MADTELYKLLCEYNTAKHYPSLCKLMKSSLPKSTPRCVRKLFSVIEQTSKKADAVGVSQLTTLLSILLSNNGYADVDKVTISHIAGLHDHFKFIRKTHYLYKIYTCYLELMLELLEIRENFNTSLPEKFSPILFSILMETNNVFSSELRIEATKSLNTLLEEEGNKLFKFLINQSVVKEHWLDIGKSVEKAGDYELQVTLMELLCRLFSPEARQQHLCTLFSDENLQQILTDFSDREFEKDCRHFLNTMNLGLKQRMVYSFCCSRVSLGASDLQIPPMQQWLDMNFGSNTLTMFVIDNSDTSQQYDTLLINPSNVSGHEYTVDGDNFHLVLKLNVPIGNLLDCMKDCQSRTVHFVLNATPSPKGPLLGLLGPHLAASPKADKHQSCRVDVSAETIKICGNETTIVQTPTTDRAMRLSQTRQMLSNNISEPNKSRGNSQEPSLSQLEFGYSQPDRKKLKTFTACEPIIANPQAPDPSPVNNRTLVQDTLVQDKLNLSDVEEQEMLIPDSLPVSVIPESQQTWKLQSSFDPTIPLNDSELSIVGEDTVKNLAIKEEHIKDEVSEDVSMSVKKPINKVSPFKTESSKNLEQSLSAINSDKIKQEIEKKVSPIGENENSPIIIKNKTPLQIKAKQEINARSKNEALKKPLEMLNTSRKKQVITIGGSKERLPTGNSTSPIKINNQRDKKINDPDEVKITDIVAVEYEGSNPSPERSIETDSPPSVEISTEFDDIPSSPGDVYKNILGIKKDTKMSSPAVTGVRRSFKRKLMDTEERFLLSQPSPGNSQSSQSKKIPMFARKKDSLNTSSSFILSKNKPMKRLEPPKKEAVLEDVIPAAPLRKSILKRKFLEKREDVLKTPQFGKFDFDEKSPRSEASWVKKHGKKKITAGFKTKKEKQEAEKKAKRLLKKEQKETISKKYTKKRKVEVSEVSDDDHDKIADLEESEKPSKLAPKSRKASPSPPPPRSTRYPMRTRGRGQKIKYKELDSDEEVVSMSASEFSTTTQSTVRNFIKHVSQPSSQEERDPVEILQDLDTSLEHILHDKPNDMSYSQKGPVKLDDYTVTQIRPDKPDDTVSQIRPDKPDDTVSQIRPDKPDDNSVSRNKTSKNTSPECSSPHNTDKTTHESAFDAALETYSHNQINSSKSRSFDEIQELSKLYDDTSPKDWSSDSDIHDDHMSSPEIDRIPSTETVGIPLTSVSDLPSFNSIVSKDPSPIIKTNRFKLPTDEIKKITMNLDPQVKTISPHVETDESDLNQQDEENMPRQTGSETDTKIKHQPEKTNKKEENESLAKSTIPLKDETEKELTKSEKKIFADIFEESGLQDHKLTRKNTRKPKNKYSKKKKTTPVVSSTSNHDSLEKLQKSFDLINSSVVLEVANVEGRKLSEVQRMVIDEEKCNDKEQKPWLSSGSSGSLVRGSEPADAITTKTTKSVTNTQMAMKFSEISNCMELNDTGLAMEIDEYHSPIIGELQVENMFTSILEESRLAAERDKTTNLISTPTRLSHIKAAEEANESPFATYLKKIGSTQSPIKAKDQDNKSAPVNPPTSRLQDSGLGTSSFMQTTSFSNISLPALTETSPIREHKRPRLKSPTLDLPKIPSQTLDLPKTPSQSTSDKKDTLIFSQKSEDKELQDYYEMLCKTPKTADSLLVPSSQSNLSQSSSWSGTQLLPSLPDLQLPTLQNVVNTIPTTAAAADTSDSISECSSMVIPSSVLQGDHHGAMALQIFHNQAKKLKERQRLKSKENVNLVFTDINRLSNKFFVNSRSKRTFQLKEFTRALERDIEQMKAELIHAKKKEDEALRCMAQCHKIQTESRISLQNKMKLVEERNRHIDEIISIDSAMDAQELRQSLHNQLHQRQKQLDKNQIQSQRQQLMKQMALIMMDMDD